MLGRIVSRPEDSLILLDDSLSPFVADALSLVGYNATSNRNVFDNRQGVTDREIIEWAGASSALWVYSDDKPKRESAKTILTEGRPHPVGIPAPRHDVGPGAAGDHRPPPARSPQPSRRA